MIQNDLLVFVLDLLSVVDTVMCMSLPIYPVLSYNLLCDTAEINQEWSQMLHYK